MSTADPVDIQRVNSLLGSSHMSPVEKFHTNRPASNHMRYDAALNKYVLDTQPINPAQKIIRDAFKAAGKESKMHADGDSAKRDQSTKVETDTDTESKEVEINVRGLSGLQNIGNTCYMNATLQALCSYPFFRYYLIYGPYKEIIQKNEIKKLWKTTERLLDLRNCIAEDHISEFLSIIQQGENRDLIYDIFKDAPLNLIKQITKTVEFIPMYFKQQLLDVIECRLKTMGIIVATDGSDTVEINKSYIGDKTDKTITHRTAEVFCALWNENVLARPDKFKNIIGTYNQQFAGEFAGTGQNDSHELLSLVLDGIHTELSVRQSAKYTKNDSVADLIRLQEQCNKILANDDCNDAEKRDAKKMFDDYKASRPQDTTRLLAYTSYNDHMHKGGSIISELFMGQLYRENKCNSCGHRTEKFDPITVLSVEIPTDGHVTDIDDCFKQFTQSEKLSDYKCEECNQVGKNESSTSVWELPEQLIIHLKRFSVTGYTATYEPIHHKETKLVNFPLTDLDVSNCCHKDNKPDHKYDLQAIVQHSGTLRFGHYVAYAQNDANDKWYEFNDSGVTYIDDSNIKRELATGDSYILFYRRHRSSKDFFDDSDDDTDEDEDDLECDDGDDELDDAATIIVDIVDDESLIQDQVSLEDNLL
jgi:ubiquitin C-terminal hydrolase